jgi:hypothetical protein
MGKKSGDLKSGVTRSKKAKPSAPILKDAATATKFKSKPEASNKESSAVKKSTSAPAKKEESSKEKSKASLEIDGLFGQLKGATTAAIASAAAKSKVMN